MDPGSEEDFLAFVVDRSGPLFRTAYLLTGDRHAAEDLVRSALTKTAAKWRDLRDPAAVEGYARRVMYHEQVSRWRRRSRVAEVPTGWPPDGVSEGHAEAVDLRLTVRTALARLAPRQRTILVLRYFEDLSETEISRLLGIRVGSVRSQIYRSLERLSAATGRPSAEFRRAARDGAALGLPPYAKGSPEGFVLPGTYDVRPSSSPGEILAATVTRSNRFAAENDLVREARRLGRTPREIMIVAGIVQAEPPDPRYMSKVARVVYNRLDHTPPLKLQVESTVLYGLGKHGEASHKDIASASPYNTYLRFGLPPGPACDPGADALGAALKPADGSWLFFVTTDRKKGTIEFVTSQAEYNRLVRKRQY
ncbi:endolytic transglycosylase MltG [Streptosporangium saharense]|uniref:endolytic transglycosylase MltG n=1 Tax=Streptosporangium saharense TaxID=1706840 RepID=UPI00343D0F2D